MIPMRKWVFNTNPNDPMAGRRVTVRARTESEALEKARNTLDQRCLRSNQEPPVGWTLFLTEETLLS